VRRGPTNHGLVGRPNQGTRTSPLRPLGRNGREIEPTVGTMSLG
jgi:hypothetical protein